MGESDGLQTIYPKFYYNFEKALKIESYLTIEYCI